MREGLLGHPVSLSSTFWEKSNEVSERVSSLCSDFISGNLFTSCWQRVLLYMMMTLNGWRNYNEEWSACDGSRGAMAKNSNGARWSGEETTDHRIGYTSLIGLEVKSPTKYIEADSTTANCARQPQGKDWMGARAHIFIAGADLCHSARWLLVCRSKFFCHAS